VHPSLCPESNVVVVQFKLIQHAYGILNDEEKRANYDKFGENVRRHHSFCMRVRSRGCDGCDVM
jgi:curved DNA-binding protein CbpA